MSNDTKNAYEIRLDVLKMAHDDCFDKYHTKIYPMASDTSDILALKKGYEDSEYPSSSQIISRAQELYKFICEK